MVFVIVRSMRLLTCVASGATLHSLPLVRTANESEKVASTSKSTSEKDFFSDINSESGVASDATITHSNEVSTTHTSETQENIDSLATLLLEQVKDRSIRDFRIPERQRLSERVMDIWRELQMIPGRQELLFEVNDSSESTDTLMDALDGSAMGSRKSASLSSTKGGSSDPKKHIDSTKESHHTVSHHTVSSTGGDSVTGNDPMNTENRVNGEPINTDTAGTTSGDSTDGTNSNFSGDDGTDSTDGTNSNFSGDGGIDSTDGTDTTPFSTGNKTLGATFQNETFPHEAYIRLKEREEQVKGVAREKSIIARRAREEHESDKHYMAGFGAFLCLIVAGIASGLTMGLVSLDPWDMELLLRTDPNDITTDKERIELETEQGYARKILPLVTDHHRLLVTLLLLNACAAETLPLLLDKLGLPKVVNVVLSVIGVLVFGEILPSAVFTGPNQLEIAAFFAGMVNVLQIMLALIVIPIGKCLDLILGVEHKGRYNKAELKALINLQIDHERNRNSDGLVQEEIRMVQGAMDLSRKTVAECMVDLQRVYMLGSDTVLHLNNMAEILGKGHSRVPIYDGHPHNIRGFLMVKNLIVLNPDDNRKINSLGLRKPFVVNLDYPLLDLLSQFQQGKSHIALVSNRPDLVRKAWSRNEPIPPHVHMAGIITLEDVIENLIQDDIKDESGVGESGVREQLRAMTNKLRNMSRVAELRIVAQKILFRTLTDGGFSGVVVANGTSGIIKSSGSNNSKANTKSSSKTGWEKGSSKEKTGYYTSYNNTDGVLSSSVGMGSNTGSGMGSNTGGSGGNSGVRNTNKYPGEPQYYKRLQNRNSMKLTEEGTTKQSETAPPLSGNTNPGRPTSASVSQPAPSTMTGNLTSPLLSKNSDVEDLKGIDTSSTAPNPNSLSGRMSAVSAAGSAGSQQGDRDQPGATGESRFRTSQSGTESRLSPLLTATLPPNFTAASRAASIKNQLSGAKHGELSASKHSDLSGSKHSSDIGRNIPVGKQITEPSHTAGLGESSPKQYPGNFPKSLTDALIETKRKQQGSQKRKVDLKTEN